MTDRSGISMIAAERARQLSEEDWTPEHDDEHDDGAIAWAAVCYAAPKRVRARLPTIAWRCGCHEANCIHGSADVQYAERERDPWPPEWPDKRITKPTTEQRIRMLVKSGALIAAEIDRLQRVLARERRADG